MIVITPPKLARTVIRAVRNARGPTAEHRINFTAEQTSFASAWFLADIIAAGVTCDLITKSREDD
jgi:hypothetical protein